MIRLIRGAAGTGKSEFVYDSICRDISDNKKVLLLVPEQEVLAAERILASRLENVNSLGLEVVSFRRFCNRVFREYGGLCKNYISRGGQAVIMWRALCQLAVSLSYFSVSDISDSSLIDRLLSFVAQMRAYRITPDRFERSVSKLDDGILRNKASDLAAVYLLYNRMVHEKYDDSSEDAYAAHELLEENGFFKDFEVYIDSFYGFTPAELDLVGDIFKGAVNVTVSLLWNNLFPDSNFERSVITRRQLTRIIEETGLEYEEIKLSDPRRFSDPSIKELSGDFWEREAPVTCFDNSNCAVTVAECGDVYDEAMWIASDIRRSVREQGLRYRDIAVIARDTQPFEGILDAALKVHGIPFHMSVREDITSYPIIRYILFALRIIERGWQRDDIITFIRTGIADGSGYEADLIENYAGLWDINSRRRWCSIWNMNPRGFSIERSDTDTKLLDRLNEIRVRLTAPLEELSDRIASAGTVSGVASCIYDFLISSGADKSVETDEEVSVWNSLCSALEDVSVCGGDERCDAATSRKILGLVFKYTSIGSIPSSVDEVTISGALLARPGAVKRVYLCSVNDGVFPAAVSDDAIFDLSDLKKLADAGIELEDYVETLANDELLYFHKSAFCASDSVVLSYRSLDEKRKKMIMSVGCRRFLELLPGLKVRVVSDEDPAECIESYEYALRHAAEYTGTTLGNALKRIFPDDRAASGTVSLSYHAPLISPDVLGRIYKNNLALTKTRIDKFLDCPFMYSCGFILKLSDIKSERYNPAEIGEFVHSVLEQYFKDSVSDVRVLPPDTAEAVKLITEEYIRASVGDPDRLTSRASALFGRLRRTSSLLIDDIKAEMDNSLFAPKFFELGIGMGEDSPIRSLKIPLGDGTDVSVYGKIDRVDSCNIGNDTFIRIVDYKTGKSTIDVKDAARSKNMQMLLYLFSICSSRDAAIKAAFGATGEILPAGVEYFHARDPVTEVKTPEDLDRIRTQGFETVPVRSGYVLDRADVLHALDKSGSGIWLPRDSKGKIKKITGKQFSDLDETIRGNLKEIALRMKKGENSVYSGKEETPCKYCPYRSVCRREI